MTPYLRALLLASLTILPYPASAADFNFSFLSPGSSGTAQGTVTGTIFGLAETGFSGATRIVASAPAGSIEVTRFPSYYDNSFEVQDGQVVGYSLFADASRGVGARWLSRYLQLTSSGGTSFVYDANDGTRRIYNPSGTPAVTFTRVEAPVVPAVPEPATWVVMLSGFGLVGSAIRHRPRAAVTYA